MQVQIAALKSAPSRSFAAMKETSDVSLVAEIAAGDRRAMQVLFARHNVKVFRFVLRMVGSEAVAEDVVSETFLSVWRQAGQFEGRSQVSTWLLAIARFKALSVLRQRTEDTLDDGVAEAIEDQSDTPETAVHKNGTNAILRQCLTRLSAVHREVIDLTYYHEKSTQEAAQIIGIPENTVKTRMFYARKHLSELLKQAGVDRMAA
jgi:RNA polymerase sigma-70 factor (ECF subfamily)